MSTTQGPYKVKIHSSAEYAYVEGPTKGCTKWGFDRDAAKEANALNAAYAEGQRSKQAELDKAVEMLGKLAVIPLGVLDGLYADEILGARAYLSTLNPQPDAAQ